MHMFDFLSAYSIFFFFNPQLSSMMGLDAIALKDDTESAKQGLSKLVSFINPDTETSEQNRLWAQESVPTNEWHITNQKTASMCVISYLI